MAGILAAGEGVVVIGQEFLARGHVDLALILGHQLLPAGAAGIAAQARRDEAEITVPGEELARWASEQAELLGRELLGKPKRSRLEWLGCAAIVRGCGGNTGKLPIAFGSVGTKSFADISALRDEQAVLVGDTRVRYGPTSKSLATRFDSYQLLPGWPTMPAFEEFRKSVPEAPLSGSLLAAVIEALARAWSATVEDVLHASYFAGKKRRAKTKGEGLQAIVIRNPNRSTKSSSSRAKRKQSPRA
ncbi:MAG: hypothetical protein HY238_10825 [Acidobacteria bacterium]|nr:hypothetical protein [Acidobacteriota bacterium]